MFCPGGSCVLLLEDGVLFALGVGRVSGAVTFRRPATGANVGSRCKLCPSLKIWFVLSCQLLFRSSILDYLNSFIAIKWFQFSNH
jgi:hypothetical protein